MIQTSLTLTIGGISVRVESKNTTFLHDLSRYYPHFVDHQSCHITANIHLTHQTLPFSDDIVVTNENNVYTIDGGEFKGKFSQKSSKAKFTMRAEASLFDSFLRVFYSIILTQHDGFLVHAAGLGKNGQAYLFAGPSESGKTTTASVAGDFTVLNDELVLVKKQSDTFYLHATPFNGNYDRPIENSSAPLKGFFFLDKQLKKGFEPVDKAQCLVQLLGCIFFFDPDPQANQRILNLSHQLVSQFDGYKINILSREHLGELVNEITEEYSYT